MLSLYVVVILAAFVVLTLASSTLVRSLSFIATYLLFSEFVVSFVLMGTITSLPELFVGINSALMGNPVLTLGNILGSNIMNLSIVTAVPVLVSGSLIINKDIVKHGEFLIFGFVTLPTLLLLIGGKTITRWGGVVLLSCFLLHVFVLLWNMKSQIRTEKFIIRDAQQRRAFYENLGIFIVAAVFLMLGAYVVIYCASNLVEALGVSSLFFGLVMISFGTTLPEVIFGIRSLSMKHEGMMLGNILGSIAFNSAFILGTTALIEPIAVTDLKPVLITFIYLISVLLFFILFVRTRSTLSRPEAFSLGLLYVLFVAIEIWMK